jgi:magnesium-transporting ATPase (P-type)
MRPDEKERVILAMKNNGRVCLMCGDGANVSLLYCQLYV